MLGDNIRKLRNANKYSLRKLAEKCNMSSGYISDIENGRATNPGYDKLEIIAKALGVPVSALLDDDINIEASINVDEDFKELYEKISNLPREDKNFVKELLKKVLD
ncbi:helix-turn-helix domain-containing protein [Clostridium senegalense]